jgi:hypothetical protein
MGACACQCHMYDLQASSALPQELFERWSMFPLSCDYPDCARGLPKRHTLGVLARKGGSMTRRVSWKSREDPKNKNATDMELPQTSLY